VSHHLDLILIELLNLASFDKEPLPPNYSIEAISASIRHLAASAKCSVEEFFYLKE
jgi:hypothetical protein